MAFLKNLFKKKAVKKLLGGGLIYYTAENDFYLDSNNIIGIRKKEVHLFRKEIRKIINNDFRITGPATRLTDTEKNNIAFRVQQMLEEEGVHVDIIPEFPTNFKFE